MLDTLASSQSGGGGRELPPAPPAYEGDMPWEKRALEEAANAVSHVDLRRTAPFLAHLALTRAVFGVDEPLPSRVAPYGMEHYDTIHSVN